MKKCTDPCALSAILVAAQSREPIDRQAQTQLATLLMTELKPLLRKAFRHIPEQDREDAFQDTFIALIQPRTPFDPSHPRANPIAYCFNVARSVTDWRGRERANARVADVEVEELGTTPSNETEVRDDLRAARALNATMFAIVAAVTLNGDTAKVAGARFDMTPSKVCRAVQTYTTLCRSELLAA
jgi:DNA-directed RNA polymerase specialized sigma24 family protein